MTLYADGGKIPFPNRKDHPPHIPTGTAGYEVFTFYPTFEEFKDFKGCIQKIEAIGAHRRSGICKIVAPEGWTPRPTKGKFKYKDDQVEHFIIQSPVEESVDRENDAIIKNNLVYKKSMTALEYRKLAQSPKYRNPYPDLRGKDIEIQYFKNMFTSHPIYGADTEGSFYDEGVNEFNMKKLGTILDETKDATGGKVIKGVNSVYLYFGMYGASFAWHVEDMELYSINLLHYGSPKYWFAIPPEASPRFERLMRQQFPNYDRQCKAFMRHKSFMVLPSLLDKYKIPYGTMIQYPNEFIITFPHGYHMGFNLGYNIAESTNFATDRWIDFGKNAVLCKCRSDMVEIDMTPYMKKYRRDQFEKWYSYWYLPKPSTDIDYLPKKKKKKRDETSSIENFSIESAKRRRTSEKNEIIEAVSSYGSRSSETTESQLSLRDSWKHRITMLWSNEPVNFFAERTFNQTAARIWPYCAVCQYFQPIHMSTSAKEAPERSPRLAFGLCFAKDPRRVPSLDLTEDRLLTCSNCCVTVHPSCYGGQSISLSALGTWLCFRCKDRNDVAIRGTSCHLCELRGGALLPCRAGADICAFVHTVCAIFNRRTVFNDANNPSCCYTHPPSKQTSINGVLNYLPKEYVYEMGDDYENSRFQCDLCGHSREGLLRCTACDEDGDPVLAHATCARQAGFLFERRNYPQVTVMICDRHQKPEEICYELSTAVGPLMDVNLGDIVIAWMDGGSRVRQGRVDRLVLRTLLTIDFEDGSVSENTLPSDIVQCGCIRQQGCRDGQHQPGSRVKVHWSDGELYDGYYRCISKTIEYTVVFANGTSARLPRADLYGADDPVPPEVRRRLRKSL
uniref:[histone H3]-trimethyl-L-lysine(9) demethylase n=1 Tax=Haemonchus contortus TaxID=6289 RepID=A0A7I4Y7A7_HAECO|nr:Transcription factor jumonji domain containing protein [Haemonchus contortus]